MDVVTKRITLCCKNEAAEKPYDITFAQTAKKILEVWVVLVGHEYTLSGGPILSS